MTTCSGRSRGMPRRRAPAENARSATPLLVGIGLVAVVVLAAIVALVAVGTDTAGGLAEPARSATQVAGEPLPVLEHPASDAAVGRPIPALTGTGLAGERVTIGPSDGPMAIALLAHWCSHCQAEVPVLVDYLAETGMPEGVQLVALSTSIDPARPNYPPSAWLEREGWTVPTLVDDRSSSGLAALGMNSFPGFVFVDDQGRVVQRLTGEVTADAFDAIVRALVP